MEFNLSTFYSGFDVQKDFDVDLSNIDTKLSLATNALANSWEAIYQNNELLEELIDMAHGFSQLDDKHKKQVNYLIASSLSNACHQCSLMIEDADYVEVINMLKAALERYGYLMFVLLNFLGKEDFAFAGSTSAKQKQTSVQWRNNCQQVEDALDSITACLKLDLSKIFVTTPEKNQFLELFIRPIFHLMEIPERMKMVTIKTLMFRNIALAVTKHGCGEIVQNSVIQSLTYYPHLPPHLAELLHTLDKKYDHIKLTEDILREISQLEFNPNDTNGPKAISEFLIKVSELSPRLILRQMSSTAQLLDNSNQSLRCSVVETCGNIVVDALKAENQASNVAEESVMQSNSQQVEGLFTLLLERFYDQNPFVRTKALQAMVKIFDIKVKREWCKSAMRELKNSLIDRSTLVRRNAIKLMYKLLTKHPFSGNHGSQLKSSVWEQRVKDIQTELEGYLPQNLPQKKQSSSDDHDDDDNMEVDGDNEVNSNEAKDLDNDVLSGSDSDDDIDHEVLNQSFREQEENLPNPEVLIRANLLSKFHKDALEFIEALEEGVNTCTTLLFSRNKSEVLEAMDFLVAADSYDIENAGQGIRRMLHLVWMKGTSDEGKSIHSHLVDCYRHLFLSAPVTDTAQQASRRAAHNLIGLTVGATVADLASLEKLMCYLYDARFIHRDVVAVLWFIYNKAGANDPDFPKAQVHGAIIVLGMLSSADHTIVQMGIEGLINVGLGEVGRNDLVLCKHSCATLLKIRPPKAVKKSDFTFAAENEAIEGLKGVLLAYSKNREWFPMAEQAIAAVFEAAAHPEDVCADIIKENAKNVFERNRENESQTASLAQLLFIVGHTAVKTIEHLETLETQFKKQKHSLESSNSGGKKDESVENELEMIGGTSEDDFSDIVVYMREKEILFGENSLLAKFGPIVKEICSKSNVYKDEMLQRSACLCLSKLMCVSSRFCEANLPLFITIMERSSDPVIRSNCVLGLGDMAVSFNNLVDENTDFLYRRLTDENLMVQRTCLMTVTFLILAGQVKVKGQLTAMAKCLENSDQGISDMCKLFFTELATKDNAIYNGFIDIFSGLSSDETLSKDAMKRIVKFLVAFIEKEKHQKQLSDKLLTRLMKSQSESQWNDIAFVLTTIPYKNEAITQALAGGYKMVSARE